MLGGVRAAPARAGGHQRRRAASGRRWCPRLCACRPPPGQFHDVFSLADAGSSQIDLHGIDSSHPVYFTLPQTHVPRSAKIHVSYAFSPSLIPQLSMIKLMMNGTLFATVQPTPEWIGRIVDADRRRRSSAFRPS